MIRSLRMRLFLGVTAVSVIVLGILSIAIDQAVHHTLLMEFDRALLEKARSLASMVEQTGLKTHFDFEAAQFPEFEPGPHAAYFEILLDGKPFQHSASLGEKHLLVSAFDKPHPDPAYCALPDGREGRSLTIAFEPLIEIDASGGVVAPPPPKLLPQCTLVVAQESSGLTRTVDQLRWLSFLLCGGATLFSGVALVIVAGRAIRPVGALARRIEAMHETDLSARLPTQDFPTELSSLVDKLNGLLIRLDHAFGRERAFTADVLHELRTPLAGLQATLEVARSRPREAAAYETSIDKSLAILAQMQALVENLLLLARAESGQLTVRCAPMDLSELVQECMANFEETARKRGLRFDSTEEKIPNIPADRGVLRIALCTLFDNAVSYASIGGVIRVRTGNAGKNVFVEITNAGHSLIVGDLPNLLKRFVRVDAARSATGVHAGLGLSICQRLLTLLRGQLTLRLDGEWFVARMDVPSD